MNKVEQIIYEEFDERLGLMVLTYTFSQLGQDRAAAITDDEIESAEENAMMSKNFIQSLMRCARRIGRECNFVNDIIPYIIENYGYLAKKKGRRS